MKNQKGFSLIELLIVIVIIGIIAAIAIPSLLRARVSANEGAMIGDTRSVISAGAAYESASQGNGYPSAMTCFATPSGCLAFAPVSYSAAAPTFLDPSIAASDSVTKQGYQRAYNSGSALGANGGVDSFCYGGIPANQDRTGVRGFGGDSAGVVGAAGAGAVCCGTGAAGGAVVDTTTCPVL